MKNRVLLIAFFVVAYLVFVIAQTPANYLVDQLKGAVPQLGLSGVSGTVWCGEARVVSYGGQRFEAVSWSLSPFGLLLGQADLDIETTSANFHAVGNVEVGLMDQSVAVNDLQLQFPISAYEQALGVAGFNLQGGIKLNLESLSYGENVISDLKGNLVWQQAGMTNTLELGDLQAEFVTEGGELVAQVKDLGGPLSADGSFVLENSGKYKVKLAMKASDPANSGLQQTLRMAGKQASDGKVYVEFADTYKLPQGLTIR